MHARNSVTKKNSWPWIAVFITVLAFTLRWHYVMATYVPVPLGGDASQYFYYAWNLTHHGVFSLSHPGASVIAPDSYRDPGYPLFLALWMKLLGGQSAWYVATLLSQALLGALTVAFSLQISRQWLSIKWASVAGLLMAIWPHSIAINGFLLTETLTGFLCALGMLLWVYACKHQHRGLAVAGGLVFGAAALTNSVLKPFCLLLAVFEAWRAPRLRKLALLLASGSLLLPVAWAFRTSQLPTSDIHSSSTGRALQNLVQGSWPAYHPAWRLSKLGNETEKANAKALLGAMDSEYELLLKSPRDGFKAIGQRMSQHPLAYMGWYLFQKPYELWGWDIEIGQGDIYPYPVLNAPFQVNPTWRALAALCHTINPLLWLLALASLPLTWLNARYAKQDFLSCSALAGALGLLAFVSLLYTALQAEPRYSIPFRALEIAMTFTSLSVLASYWKRYREHQPDDQA
jgi:hypothetical protein